MMTHFMVDVLPWKLEQYSGFAWSVHKRSVRPIRSQAFELAMHVCLKIQVSLSYVCLSCQILHVM